MVLTCDVKWHRINGENAEIDPTIFDFIEGKGQRTTISENARNKKENDKKLDLWVKELPPPVNEYKFDEIEDDKNLGGNVKQIKTQDAAMKKPTILHIPKQTVIVNPKVEVIPNNIKTRKINKLRSGNLLDDPPKKIVTGDSNIRRIYIGNLNHVQYKGEGKHQ